MDAVFGKKKKITDIVKIKPLAEVNIGKVVAVAGAGMFAGAVYGVLKQVASLDFMTEGELDPPAPCMQDLDPELVLLFKKYMGPFHRICPEKYQARYQERVRRAIRNAEAIMVIESQLLRKEIPRDQIHRNQCQMHLHFCMKHLRHLVKYYDTEILMSVRDNADVIFVNLAVHVNNVRVLTASF